MENDILNLINNNNWSDAINKINDLFTPIFHGKTIFHYACTRGNEEVIQQYLNLKSDLLNNLDNDGNTGAHLLALNEFDDLLTKIINTLPSMLKIKNNNDQFIFNIIYKRHHTFKRVLDCMEKNKLLEYLNYIRNDGRTILLDIIDNENTELLTMLSNLGINWDIPKNLPPLLYAIDSDHNDVTKFILSEIKPNVNIISSNQYTPLILSILKGNEELALKILEYDNVDVNYAGFENKNVPLSLCFKNGLINIAEKILTNNNVNHNKLDNNLNTPIYYLINYAITNKINKTKKVKKILELMISKSDMNNLNIRNETPFFLLVKYNLWKDYEKWLYSKNIDLTAINQNNETIAYHLNKNKDNLKEFIKFAESKIKNNKIKEINLEKIILPSTSKHNSKESFGLFNADGIHNIIYLCILLSKYKDLGIPIQSFVYEKKIWENYKLFNFISSDNKETLSYITIMTSYLSLYFYNFYEFIPALIIWRNKYVNFFYDNIDLYLKREINSNKRFVAMKITIIIDEQTLHANIVVYDKLSNRIIRFEPYADWELIDTYQLDEMIINMFKKSIEDIKIKTLKYIRPGEYLNNTKFQTASREENKNLGDPGGYCLAWCYWFLELKLQNPDIDERKLVESALNQIIKFSNKTDENPLLTYIRGYSKQLDSEKNKIFDKLNININEYYKLSHSEDTMDKIKQYVGKVCKIK